MNRRQARKEAFLLIFQAEFRREEPISSVLQIAQDEREGEEEYNDYVRTVYYGVWEHIAELDELICQNARGWKLSRLSRVSLALLRLATYEMLYVEDAPYHVAINEALELAKEYPQYGFNVHKGYGTKAHYEALRSYGACPIHRMSFLKKFYGNE